MNHATKLLLGTTAIFMAVAANAAATMPGQDGYHYSNGGTGYIGLTESAGQPRAMGHDKMWTAQSDMVSRTPSAAGEASTMVDGQPNQNPDAPMADSTMGKRAPQAWAQVRSQTQSMGSARNPAWGTPD